MKNTDRWKRMRTIPCLVLGSLLIIAISVYAQPEVPLPAYLCQSSLSSEAVQACNDYVACLASTIVPTPASQGKQLAGNLASVHFTRGLTLAEFKTRTSERRYPRATLAYNSAEEACAEQFEAEMLNQCMQPVCERQTLINMAVVAAAVDYAYERPEADAFQRTLVRALNAFAHGAYQDAAGTLDTMFREYPHRYLAYGMALAYEAAGMSAEAVNGYHQALEVQFYTPLVYYSRGQYYLSQNQPDLADRDFYTFSVLSSGVHALSGLSMPQNTLAEAFHMSEPWKVYPVITNSASPGGERIRDLLQLPEHQADMLWLDGGETLAVRHLVDSGTEFGQPVPEILFLHCQSDRCSLALSFQRTFPGLSSGGTLIEVIFHGAYAESTVTFQGSEWVVWAQSVILPMGVADPRPQVPCQHGALPRLKVGDEVYSQSIWVPVTVYAEPSIVSDVVIELTGREWQTMTVTGSFVCGEDGNWWPVSLSNDQHGWVLEATNGYYFLTTSDLRGTRAAIEDILHLPPATDE